MSAANKCLGTEVHRGKVRSDWIDFNQHMNVAYYVLAFDLGIDALWSDFGINEEYVQAKRGSTFAVESHVLYKRELLLDDPYIVTSQILAFDEKRIHQFQRMYHATDGFLAATAEWMSLHVDIATRRVSPWPEDILESIRRVAGAQGEMAYPGDAGRSMQIKTPLFAVGNGSI